MRRLVVLVALTMLLVTAPAWAATARVQCVVGAWSSGTSWTTSITATTGHLLVVSVHFLSANLTNDFTTLSDGTNTYTAIDSLAAVILGTNTSLNTFYAKNITGGALTVTSNSTSNVVAVARTVVCEVSGANTSTPLDKHAIQTQALPGTGTDALTSGSVTTTTNGQYVYGATVVGGNDTLTAGTGFTGYDSTANTMAEDQVQSSAGAIAGTFTAAQHGDLNTFITGVATFKAAAAASAIRHRAVQQ